MTCGETEVWGCWVTLLVLGEVLGPSTSTEQAHPSHERHLTKMSSCLKPGTFLNGKHRA